MLTTCQKQCQLPVRCARFFSLPSPCKEAVDDDTLFSFRFICFLPLCSEQIPDQPWFLWSCFTITVGGILPYGAVFIEMFFILQSLWMGSYYYVFGFLMLVFIILVITCADIAMVFCYFQLCAEDYNWSVNSSSSSSTTVPERYCT